MHPRPKHPYFGLMFSKVKDSSEICHRGGSEAALSRFLWQIWRFSSQNTTVNRVWDADEDLPWSRALPGYRPCTDHEVHLLDLGGSPAIRR